ncbi:MAG: helix-turn-helix domain-containing protein [Paraglaciecola sp.]|nr:helix-turn-helix domain-containing protein [Paraglaciecola sp.]
MAAQQKHPLTFGTFLKFWRNVHQLSQEQLAFCHGSSARHISRLENGISRPSESFIEEIAQALTLGERDRNQLRMSAGYSPMQKKVSFNDPQLKWLRKAMRLTLKSMDPYPTTLTDSAGNLLMVNRGWVGFYQKTLPNVDISKIHNIYDFMFSSDGSGAIISDWDNTLSLILMALQQETMLSEDEDKKALLKRLLENTTVPKDWKQRAAKLEPMASFRLQINYDGSLKQFYNVSQTVGAMGPAAYASQPNLTITTLYPEDESIDLTHLLDGDLDHPLLFKQS